MTRGTRPAVALGAALLLAALAPAGAPASTAQVTGGGSFNYNAAAGEVNDVTITQGGGVFTITDPGAPITAGPGCAAVNPNQVTCADAGVTFISIFADDMNDEVALAGSVRLPTDFSFPISIRGGFGNDTIAGAPNSPNFLEGDVDSFTGTGNDVLTGGRLFDAFSGAGGNDVFNGGAGRDQFFSDFDGDGADVYNGGNDVDSAFAFGRREALRIDLDGVADDGAGCPGPGCEGDNFKTDVEEVGSGNGNDVLIGNAGINALSSSNGDDVLIGAGGPDQLFGGQDEDTLRAGAGADSLFGDTGDDRMFAGAGDDTLFSTLSDDDDDLFSGGKGTDLADYSQANARVRVDLDGRADDGVAGERDNVRPDVEDLFGSDGADVLIGSPRDNQIEGGQGNDRIVTKAGLDAAIGGEGGDTLVTGAGRDLAEGGAGADRIRARDGGPDEVSCGSSVDRVKADRADRTGVDCDRVARR